MIRWFLPAGGLHLWSGVFLSLAVLAGCGTTKSQLATEQLLVSDAVDRTIASIDFRVLQGRRVYFDTQYVKPVKGTGFVNSDYIISSLRQQLFAAGCMLQDKPEEADYIVEARVGALGTDSHDIVYGIPANNALSSAASLVPNGPQLPTVPEIALAKRNQQLGAAKIGVFAYNRKTKQPVWQAGIAQAKSTARDFWVFGAGPFQHGTIYEETQFAGNDLSLPVWHAEEQDSRETVASYEQPIEFPVHLGLDLTDGTRESEGTDETDGQPGRLSDLDAPDDATEIPNP